MSYYIFVENNQIVNCGEIPCTSEGVINYEVTEEFYNEVNKNRDIYIYSDGKVILNPDYKSIINEKIKQENIRILQEQIDEIDKKRVRAICEPSVKDLATGQTWLEYYNNQIAVLRSRMNNL